MNINNRERLANALGALGKGGAVLGQARMEAEAKELENARRESQIRLAGQLETTRAVALENMRAENEQQIAGARIASEEATRRQSGQEHADTIALQRESLKQSAKEHSDTLQVQRDQLSAEKDRYARADRQSVESMLATTEDRIDTQIDRLRQRDIELQKLVPTQFDAKDKAQTQAEIKDLPKQIAALQQQRMDSRLRAFTRLKSLGAPEYQVDDVDIARAAGYPEELIQSIGKQHANGLIPPDGSAPQGAPDQGAPTQAGLVPQGAAPAASTVSSPPQTPVNPAADEARAAMKGLSNVGLKNKLTQNNRIMQLMGQGYTYDQAMRVIQGEQYNPPAANQAMQSERDVQSPSTYRLPPGGMPTGLIPR
jgi:hypothetical protein